MCDQTFLVHVRGPFVFAIINGIPFSVGGRQGLHLREGLLIDLFGRREFGVPELGTLLRASSGAEAAQVIGVCCRWTMRIGPISSRCYEIITSSEITSPSSYRTAVLCVMILRDIGNPQLDGFGLLSDTAMWVAMC